MQLPKALIKVCTTIVEYEGKKTGTTTNKYKIKHF